MPSVVVGIISGGQNILSGNYFSGLGASHPVGGVQLLAWSANSGSVYVALSGGITINSGVLGSGGSTSGGRMDGIQLTPGIPYFLPKVGFSRSGTPQVFVTVDAAGSGQARLYYEVY